MSRDIRTKAFMLKRTNYGEADRILQILTENGEINAIAKGVRKEKAKLAGGIELFTLNEITYHEGKNNTLCTLTSAKMVEHYDKIPVSLDKLELASSAIRLVAGAAADGEGREYFDLVLQTLREIDKNDRLTAINAWFLFNLAKVKGEAINFSYDTDDEALAEDLTYVWDTKEQALRKKMGGDIGVDGIKFVRYMLEVPLASAMKVTGVDGLLPSLIFIAKSINKI